jgi:hypothetical protein
MRGVYERSVGEECTRGVYERSVREECTRECTRGEYERVHERVYESVCVCMRKRENVYERGVYERGLHLNLKLRAVGCNDLDVCEC